MRWFRGYSKCVCAKFWQQFTHSPLSSDHGCSNDMTPKKIASETRVIQHFEDQWNQNQPPLYHQLQSNFGCQPNFFQVGILALSATAGRDYHSWRKSHLTLPTLRSVWIKVMLRPKALRESLQFPADIEGSMTRKCHLTVQFTHSRPNLPVCPNSHHDFGRVRRYFASNHHFLGYSRYRPSIFSAVNQPSYWMFARAVAMAVSKVVLGHIHFFP